ncbi:MAG: pyruvate kinase [Methylovulum sp.]|uniref:pyruvate kinase n=1 Tax=Methylovulum sp. TaxID=1916980 RepID=UPI0026309877|nr:pyruvate kinase [Methylovulum sp.]MDD2723158.1 pyruvate kinase [Methylovulum sp.]MDD5126030.1 pyruvate kinase [Methylovulum sp.]
MTELTNHDIYDDTLKQLLVDVADLREKITAHAASRLDKYQAYYRAGAFNKSALNLAYYLALRQFDLRHLQDRLAQAGLSSLGRSEASVLSTLDAVIDVLKRATDKAYSLDDKNPSESGFNRGLQLLEQHNIELFGPFHEHSKVHVMVTLASETAWNYELILALLEKGMTCARINCAHDDEVVWRNMIRNIRRAETETGKICRILMDLAGHKIRTGAIALGLPVHHIKVKKDVRGNVIAKGQLLLIAGDATQASGLMEGGLLFRVSIPDALHQRLSPGCRLGFIDARGKQRYLLIEQAVSDKAWLASCGQSSYLESGCEVDVLASEPTEDTNVNERFNLGEFAGGPLEIRCFKNDLLLLTENDVLGKPAEYDDNGDLIQPAQIGCTLSAFSSKLAIGQPVWIDDGKLGAVVEALTGQGALLRVNQVRSSGVGIQSDKGINFPDTQLGLSPLSEKDLQDLDFACTHADLIGFSFVETLADMDYLMDELAKRNATELPIIAKIETNLAVKNLPDIILGTIGRHTLGIMIARGDLAVELGSARLAEIQEELLWLCEAAHVPVIWATQVLESIAKKGVRSRPEFTDAAMAVRAECVMLNKGPYILDAIEALVNVMIRMQEHQRKKFSRLRALHW